MGSLGSNGPSKAAEERTGESVVLRGDELNTQQQIDFDICAANHRGNPESVAAHESIKETKRATWTRILAELRKEPLSCQEIEFRCRLLHQTASARLTELKAQGLIVADGKRATVSGRWASVYRVVAA